MRPRFTRREIAERRLDARMKEVKAIERAARTGIRIYQAQAKAAARGKPLSEFWLKEARALAAAWL